MIRRPIKLRTRIVLGVAAFAIVIIAYGWMSYRVHQGNPKNKTIPTLSQFQQGWQRMFSDDEEVNLWTNSWVSLQRFVLGLLLGVLLAVVIGVLMGSFAPIEAFFLPPVAFFAKIPPTAMLAVYFVFVGVTGIKIFVALIALGIFPTLAQAIAQAAAKDVDDHAIDKAYTLGASHFEVVWEVIVKQILPRIIENVRLQIGPAMVFLIAAEFALADAGVGYVLRMQSRLQNMNIVYSYLILLGAFGLLIDWLLTLARRKICPWFGA